MLWSKKIVLLVATLVVVGAGIGYLIKNNFPYPEFPKIFKTIPTQPIVIAQPTGDFNCNYMYDEIENDLDYANLCRKDSDCSVIMLGSSYIEFGCYHFINKDVDQEQFYTKMDSYNRKCSQMINLCAPAPEAECVSNKCVYVEQGR